MVAILKFKMAAANEGANVIIGLIEFLDPENIGLGTAPISCLYESHRARYGQK